MERPRVVRDEEGGALQEGEELLDRELPREVRARGRAGHARPDRLDVGALRRRADPGEGRLGGEPVGERGEVLRGPASLEGEVPGVGIEEDQRPILADPELRLERRRAGARGRSEGRPDEIRSADRFLRRAREGAEVARDVPVAVERDALVVEVAAVGVRRPEPGRPPGSGEEGEDRREPREELEVDEEVVPAASQAEEEGGEVAGDPDGAPLEAHGEDPVEDREEPREGRVPLEREEIEPREGVAGAKRAQGGAEEDEAPDPPELDGEDRADRFVGGPASPEPAGGLQRAADQRAEVAVDALEGREPESHRAPRIAPRLRGRPRGGRRTRFRRPRGNARLRARELGGGGFRSPAYLNALGCADSSASTAVRARRSFPSSTRP